MKKYIDVQFLNIAIWNEFICDSCTFRKLNENYAERLEDSKVCKFSKYDWCQLDLTEED